MAFDKEGSRTPVAIADISIQLFDPDPTGVEQQGATFSVQIRMSDGSLVVRTGDLVEQITVAQRNALMGFMASLRQQAIAQILP